MNPNISEENALPAWMCQHQDYDPPTDRDAFITKSTEAILGVLSKLKTAAGKDGRYSASPALKVLYTVLYILLTACSRNFTFTLVMGACTLAALALHPAKMIRQVLAGTIGAVAFSAVILLPAVFMGSPKTLLTVTAKVFVSVTLVGILSVGTSWNKLTASLRAFHVPDLFIFTLDTTLKYISMLGEICMAILMSLRLRSVGRNRRKAGAFSGILGITFLKSREMSEEMYAAMCCRGFTGEYARPRKLTMQKQDIAYLLMMAAAVGLFFYLRQP